MNIRDSVLHCIDAAEASNQPLSIGEQLHAKGEGAKFIALMRCLPHALRQRVLGIRDVDVLPFPAGAIHDTPDIYGAEALVHKVASTETPLVVKRYRSFMPTAEHLAFRRQRQQEHINCFGSLVANVSFVVTENPSASKYPAVVGVQEAISGKHLYDPTAGINPESIAALREGTDSMLNRYGFAPDLLDGRNVIVDPLGDAHIVDCGNVISGKRQSEIRAIRYTLRAIEAEVAPVADMALAS